MNKTDPERQRGDRILKAAEAFLSDVYLEELSLCERIERDLLPEQGVVSSREIVEGLSLDA